MASNHDPGRVYLSQTGFREDDFSTYLFRSDDFGESWASIVGNLPMESVNVIPEDPQLPDVLYVGTDLGVYVSGRRGGELVLPFRQPPNHPGPRSGRPPQGRGVGHRHPRKECVRAGSCFDSSSVRGRRRRRGSVSEGQPQRDPGGILSRYGRKEPECPCRGSGPTPTYPSIFNDVIGPVMRGPSSSHCAAAVRIGRLARDLMGGEITEVLVEFHPDGSLATTHESQGSDMGLFGGFLGWEATDERLVQSAEAMPEAGIEVEIRISDFPAFHPNTYRITLRNEEVDTPDDGPLHGGRDHRVVEIDGLPVSMAGDFHETLISWMAERWGYGLRAEEPRRSSP